MAEGVTPLHQDEVLIGAAAVGKTMICSRLKGYPFGELYDETTEEEQTETITTEGKDYRILDTAGQPEYSLLRGLIV